MTEEIILKKHPHLEVFVGEYVGLNYQFEYKHFFRKSILLILDIYKFVSLTFKKKKKLTQW